MHNRSVMSTNARYAASDAGSRFQFVHQNVLWVIFTPQDENNPQKQNPWNA
jgi:hypothetical protein